MTASKIPVGDTGKDLQTWENDLGDGPVHTEAQTPTDTLGIPFGLTNPQDVRDASPRITRRLDAQDLLGDALFGIVGDGAVLWRDTQPHPGPFAVYPEYLPALNDSAGFSGPSFERMQDTARYGGLPFYRFSATGGADGGWVSIGAVVDVRPNTQYEASILIYASDALVTSQISLGIADFTAGLFPVVNNHSSAAYPYQAQRYSGRYTSAGGAVGQYDLYPTILVYVPAGAVSATILDVVEFGMREVPDVTVRAAAKPADWDYAEVISMTADYQPIVTERRRGGSGGILVATATCTYDEPVPGTFVLTSLEWT